MFSPLQSPTYAARSGGTGCAQDTRRTRAASAARRPSDLRVCILIEYSLISLPLHERTHEAGPAGAPLLVAASRARGPRAADRAPALGLRAAPARRRSAVHDRGRAAGLRDAGARRNDPTLADGHARRGREPGKVHPVRDREG